MRKIWNLFFNRTFILAMLIFLQLLFTFLLFYVLSVSYSELDIFLQVLSIIMIFYIINRPDNPSYKLVWCIAILVMPFIGGIFYLMFGGKKVPRALRKTVLQSAKESMQYLYPHDDVMDEIRKKDVHVWHQFNYVYQNAYFPAYKNTEVSFFKSGEEKFATLVQELNKARKTIYLEYFIIDEGVMWDTVLTILKDKVKEGVDVRLIYDDAGCFETLPKGYEKKVRELGIQCEIFNPLRPQLAMQMNNRDHRKLVIIDNEVAFTGGINLADEYINKINRFGHWKDTAVMLKGEAVWNCTIMFLQFWNFLSENKISYLDFKKEKEYKSDGYILPFSDSPTDEEEVGLTVHMNLIQNAKETVYIQTPYLIISYEMKKALSNAAKSGVDVRIIVPHIPDKWYAHMMTKGNYRELIKSGVKIYEYLPGFIHSKTMLCDKEVGICGTINMDYRSYYMHYEDGVLMYQCSALKRMEEDYQETLDISQLITIEDCDRVKLPIRLFHAILNLFSPLM